MTISISNSSLLGWYQSFFGGSGTGVPAATTGTGSASVSATPRYAPTPPWDPAVKQPAQSALVQAALGGAPLINVDAAKLDLAGASADYKKLFALYQGVSTLYDLANAAAAAGLPASQKLQLQNAFTEGLSQLQRFVSTTPFGGLRLALGGVATSETATTSVPAQATSYQTPVLNDTGNSSAIVPAFQGAVAFDVTIQNASGTQTVAMNLADMGSTPRTLGNVVAYLNGQLQAAGAVTQFASVRIPGQAQVVKTATGSFTLPQSPDQWALKLNTIPEETVSLSAPPVGNAVYVGEVIGNQTAQTGAGGAKTPADAQSQLLKIQTSGAAVSPPPAIVNNAAPGQIFVDQFGKAVNSVQATATAPDGSVYVLADVNASPSGQAAAGGQDVALLKYDSAGQLQFTQDLGAASNASGLALAVSADGSKIAVAGSVAGPLTAGQTVASAAATNSFVTTYNSQGQQLWTAQNPTAFNQQATAVAFAADGSVYVAGQEQTSLAGSAAAVNGTSGSQAYLQGFSAAGAALSTTRFGASGPNTATALTVNGSTVYVAGAQNGDGVVQSFDISTPGTPTLSATRDLGALQGGDIVGLGVSNGQLLVAGSTTNGALAAGTVTSPSNGRLDAFAATLDPSLAPSSSDAVAYYGGAGSTRATAAAISNGQVWITGSSTGALPGLNQLGVRDGFVAQLNVTAGSTTYAQNFTGLDGQAAPTSIAVAPGGASILDQLGLPSGVVDGPRSNLVTATTGVKAGDSFGIAVGSGGPTTVTVSATDTLASLATKISRATGFNVSATATTLLGATTLKLAPTNPTVTITLSNGPAGADALSGLGLGSGVLDQTTTVGKITKPADGRPQIYGLGVNPNLNLNSTSSIGHAQNALIAALAVIKGAYQNLKTASTPASVLALQKATAAGGNVPKYLTDQIANYQAALTRLTGGTTSSSVTGA
ncbi:MAG: beta strand repeat-containing protein [Caulobacterales bacterium]